MSTTIGVRLLSSLAVGLMFAMAAPAAVIGQDQGTRSEGTEEAGADDTDESTDEAAAIDERFQHFEEMLNGARLIGSFTVLGGEVTELQTEEYTINRVAKLETGDYWMFEARIKYGTNDYTVPIPLEVKWAEDTPMVTLTDLSILGQGPFSARVLFYDNKYAGTWSHGEVGGHLFGRIERGQPADDGDGDGDGSGDDGDGDDGDGDR